MSGTDPDGLLELSDREKQKAQPAAVVLGSAENGNGIFRLLKALRHSLQKPQRRASQRDEEAIERWKEQRWPQLKKGR